jgi:hypothetical protein
MVALLTATEYARAVCVLQSLVFFRAHPGSFSIGPLRQQVLDAYRSVFAYFLFRTGERRAWLNFVALQWHARWRKGGELRSFRSMSRALEGRGDVAETIALFFAIVRLYWRKLLKQPPTLFGD